MYNLLKFSKYNNLHSLKISLSQLSIILSHKPLTDAKDKTSFTFVSTGRCVIIPLSVLFLNINSHASAISIHMLQLYQFTCFSYITLGKNACKIANMRYAYPAVIQVKISNIGCLDEVVGFILSKWRTTAINSIKNKTQHFGK